MTASRWLLVLALAAPPFLAACGPTPPQVGRPVHSPERTTAAAAEVSDDAFASAVRDLLAADPGSRERSSRAAGVCARQMVRSSARFRSKSPDRALSAIGGAMAVLRPGDLTPSALGPEGPTVMRAAALELAKKGDEGRARAVYEILMKVVPDAERPQIKAHLDAIQAWVKDTSGAGPVEQAGGQARAAVSRALLEPSPEAAKEADQKVAEWLEKAIVLRNAYRARKATPTPKEGNEALRARGSAGPTLAALHLRHADVHGALAALERGQAKEVTRPELVRAMEAAADKPSAGRWLDVARALRPTAAPSGARDDDDEAPQDQDLARAAAFGAVMEAYRLDPTLPEAAGSAAAFLMDYGMGEAAPAVLAEAVKANPEPRVVQTALGMTLRAMAEETQNDEPDAARRVFKAAAPLLAVADRPDLAPKLRPGPARVRAMMGEIEVREGRLGDARALLEQAAAVEKSAATLLLLARIDWHDQKSSAALARLREAQGLPDAQKDVGLRAEILLAQSDILREEGDAQGARAPLVEALKDLAKVRQAGEAEDRARIERAIARVLDRFGATAPAAKALDRALDASARDKRQAAATVGQQVARAFVMGDLKTAREALARGVAFELEGGDLVYYAMWVRVLEKQQRAPSDGTAERVLTHSKGDQRWVGRIAAFGLGLVKADALVAAAKTPAQKTEALFYAAIERRAAGDVKGGDDALRQAVAAGGLELMEVAIARDILSGAKARLSGPVPEVGLP